MKIKIKRRRAQIQAGKNISVVEADANTIISADDPPPGSGTEGDPISVVGSDGKLNTVPKHSTWATPSAFPTKLRTENGVDCMFDADGLIVTDGTTEFHFYPLTGELLVIGPSGQFKIDASALACDISVDASGVVINNGSNNLTIDPALITENMSIREIDVCDSGTPATMLVLGSAPY